MKASEFDFSKDLQFDTQTGVASFRNSRVVIFDASAMGLLRQELIDNLGVAKARTLLLQFGYQQGYADFLQMKINYQFESELELLASGPVIHTWEGVVKATPSELRFDRGTGEFYFTGTWDNSYEGEQHLSFNPVGTEACCWTLSGYASGWCHGFFGQPVVCVEPRCVCKGDSSCSWLIRPLKDLGLEAKPVVEALSRFMGGR